MAKASAAQHVSGCSVSTVRAAILQQRSSNWHSYTRVGGSDYERLGGTYVQGLTTPGQWAFLQYEAFSCPWSSGFGESFGQEISGLDGLHLRWCWKRKISWSYKFDWHSSGRPFGIPRRISCYCSSNQRIIDVQKSLRQARSNNRIMASSASIICGRSISSVQLDLLLYKLYQFHRFFTPLISL